MLLGHEKPIRPLVKREEPASAAKCDAPKEKFADYQRRQILARRERVYQVLAASDEPMLRKHIAAVVGVGVDTIRFDLLALHEERRVKSFRIANMDLWSVCHVGA
jgi:hypothetical protein